MYVKRATQVLRRLAKFAKPATDFNVVAHKGG